MSANTEQVVEIKHTGGIARGEKVVEITGQTGQAQPLVSVGIEDFLQKNIPPPKLIMEPWLPERGLAMIHAQTGVGKTHIALNVAYAVCSGGSFLNWNVGKPQGVLYIDGEMSEADLQHRIAQIAETSEQTPQAPFHVCNIEQQVDRGMPDISTATGEGEVWELITDEINLIVLDNLSTLSLGGRENESESWTNVQQWLLALRAAGKSVLLVHHSGKNGLQRGTSKREDVLNTVIDLKRASDYNPEDGARFEIHFRKSRGIHGARVKPIEARLGSTPDGGDKCEWTWRPLEESTHQKVVELFLEENSQVDIAKELDLNKSTVNRHIKRARRDGEIT